MIPSQSAAQPGSPAKASAFAFMWRAFQYKNYRLFFLGQIVSLIGTWMTITATSWLAYRLTGSALLLGTIGFASQFPAFLLSPFAGLFVDRWSRQRLLIVTQIASMLGSFALAYLTLTHRITVADLLIVSVFQSLVTAFDLPCRQAFLVDIIEKKEDFGNAIALNSSMFNLARLIGPSIAGMIIAASGEGWCFFIDGVSFIAVIAALAAMTIRTQAPKASSQSNFHQLREGWTYVSQFSPIRSIILLLAFVSLVGIPYGVLMPIFAGAILHGDAHTLGYLMTASGCGALLGALWLAARKSVLGLGRTIPIAAAVFGLGLITFSFSRILWVSLLLMIMTGCGFMIQMAASNTILQTIVDDDKRGRVMSFFMMAFLGMTPFGSLLAGSLSQKIGAPHTLMFGGICCIAGAAWFASGLKDLRKAIRPIYLKMGIIKELAIGVETSSELLGPPEA